MATSSHLWAKLGDVHLKMVHTIRREAMLGGQRLLQLLRATWADYDIRRLSHLGRPNCSRRSPAPTGS